MKVLASVEGAYFVAQSIARKNDKLIAKGSIDILPGGTLAIVSVKVPASEEVFQLAKTHRNEWIFVSEKDGKIYESEENFPENDELIEKPLHV
jgi:hypothetical protein